MKQRAIAHYYKNDRDVIYELQVQSKITEGWHMVMICDNLLSFVRYLRSTTTLDINDIEICKHMENM